MNLQLHPGNTPSGKKVIWSGADNPHLYISGQSGTGKSHLVKRLAAQAAEQGALIIVLDYTHDFLDYTPPNGLHFQRIDVTSSDFKLNPLISMSDKNPDIRAQQLLAALHSMFRMGARATISLQKFTTEYLTKNESPTLDGLLGFISALKKSGNGLESAMEPLALLATLIHSGSQPISLDLGTPGLVVLDCSPIIDRSLLKFIIELILQMIWTAHMPDQPPLVLILDEAQQLHWGGGSMSVRILREGRKFGIGGWFSSQWIDHKEAVSALGQAANQIYFRPDGQHVNGLANAICGGSPDVAQCRKVLEGLPRGRFLWKSRNGKVMLVNVVS